MAESPSHKFGQIIGDLLEAALAEPFERIAQEYDLYLDRVHARPARQGRRKVSWVDFKGNKHDLDYVFEENGSEDVIGAPRAFIEVAWRRYTKHSRNKAQEIQGAIIPLAATYSNQSPFLGVVLAGVFTEGSLTQLKSHGFSVLYFPYEKILDAFTAAQINAAFDEDTPRADIQEKVESFDALNESQKNAVALRLRTENSEAIEVFLQELKVSLERKVAKVIVWALHGNSCELRSLEEAIEHLTTYDENQGSKEFVRYELIVRYCNEDEVRGEFGSKMEAIKFLNKFV